MRRCCVLAFLLTVLFQSAVVADPVASSKANPAELVISWVFDIKMDNTETPRGKVSLFVNGRVILLRPAVVGQYNVIERTEYKDKGIPTTALTACSGWWAGAGEDLYVIRRKKQLIVYIRYLDEGTSSSSFVRLKTIQLKG
jgi:hypothetical protein